jgi:hypothetical protein
MIVFRRGIRDLTVTAGSAGTAEEDARVLINFWRASAIDGNEGYPSDTEWLVTEMSVGISIVLRSMCDT